MSLNKDKLPEIELLPKNYTLLSSHFQTQCTNTIVENTIEDIYEFNKVNHIFDQVSKFHINL